MRGSATGRTARLSQPAGFASKLPGLGYEVLRKTVVRRGADLREARPGVDAPGGEHAFAVNCCCHAPAALQLCPRHGPPVLRPHPARPGPRRGGPFPATELGTWLSRRD